MNNRIIRIFHDYRDAVKQIQTSSGTIATRRQQEQLLDDVFDQINEFGEARRAERDKQTELDKRFKSAEEKSTKPPGVEVELYCQP